MALLPMMWAQAILPGIAAAWVLFLPMPRLSRPAEPALTDAGA